MLTKILLGVQQYRERYLSYQFCEHSNCSAVSNAKAVNINRISQLPTSSVPALGPNRLLALNCPSPMPTTPCGRGSTSCSGFTYVYVYTCLYIYIYRDRDRDRERERERKRERQREGERERETKRLRERERDGGVFKTRCLGFRSGPLHDLGCSQASQASHETAGGPDIMLDPCAGAKQKTRHGAMLTILVWVLKPSGPSEADLKQAL